MPRELARAARHPRLGGGASVTAASKWSVVGSANMDIRSKQLNQESVIGILDPEFGAQLEATYEDDLRGGDVRANLKTGG